jgi:hypothetical protein
MQTGIATSIFARYDVGRIVRAQPHDTIVV